MLKNFFCLYILHLSRKQVHTLTKVNNKIHLIKGIRLNLFILDKKKSAEEVKAAVFSSFLGETQMRKNTHILPGL